jgi:hypothetical protein
MSKMKKIDDIPVDVTKIGKKKPRTTSIDKSKNKQKIDELLVNKKEYGLSWSKLKKKIEKDFGESYTVHKLRKRAEDLRVGLACINGLKTKKEILKVNEHLIAAELVGAIRDVRTKVHKSFNKIWETGQNIGHPLSEEKGFAYLMIHLCNNEKSLLDKFGFTKDFTSPKLIESAFRQVNGGIEETLIQRIELAQTLKSDEHYKKEVKNKLQLQKERNRINKDNKVGYDGDIGS